MVNIITTSKKELDTFETLHKKITIEVFKSHKADKPSLDLVHKCELLFNGQIESYGGLTQKFKIYPGLCYKGRLKKEFMNFRYHNYEVELPLEETAVCLFSLDSATQSNFIGVSLTTKAIKEETSEYFEVGGIVMQKEIATYQYAKTPNGDLSYLATEYGTLINFKNPTNLLGAIYNRKKEIINGNIRFKESIFDYALPIALDLMVLLYSLTDTRPNEDKLLLS